VRVFIAFPDHVAVAETAPGVEEAYDIMTADGVPPQQAADLAVAASRTTRERPDPDPAAWARKFVSLRQAVRR
jgi:hypothetical protein